MRQRPSQPQIPARSVTQTYFPNQPQRSNITLPPQLLARLNFLDPSLPITLASLNMMNVTTVEITNYRARGSMPFKSIDDYQLTIGWHRPDTSYIDHPTDLATTQASPIDLHRKLAQNRLTSKRKLHNRRTSQPNN